MNINEAEIFINSLKWQYAKSYPTAPHEYSALRWNPEQNENFVLFAKAINEHGRDEKFYSKTFRVWKIGEYKYWTMDFPLENTDLINRTFIEEAKKKKIQYNVKKETFKFEKFMTLKQILEM